MHNSARKNRRPHLALFGTLLQVGQWGEGARRMYPCMRQSAQWFLLYKYLTSHLHSILFSCHLSLSYHKKWIPLVLQQIPTDLQCSLTVPYSYPVFSNWEPWTRLFSKPTTTFANCIMRSQLFLCGELRRHVPTDHWYLRSWYPRNGWLEHGPELDLLINTDDYIGHEAVTVLPENPLPSIVQRGRPKPRRRFTLSVSRSITWWSLWLWLGDVNLTITHLVANLIKDLHRPMTRSTTNEHTHPPNKHQRGSSSYR